MLVNAANLQTLYTSYRANFQSAFAGVAPMWQTIATRVPSTTNQNQYAWLGDFPRMREWLGDRVINQLKGHQYTVQNKSFESTISVKREDIEDDQYGVYAPMFSELGRSAASFPDELVFAMLQAGFGEKCYDGQFFFDTDHPVGAGTVSNYQAGAGPAWFLMDGSRALKPLILQVRKEMNFVRKDAETDENVFHRREFLYGVDGRLNVGYGFWQTAFASKATLDATSFNANYEALMSFKDDAGNPLGVRPTHLVVGPSNRAKALEIVKAERNAAGATNINQNAVDVLISPYL